MNGFKFLDPTGATYYNDNATIYPLPGPDEKWGPEFTHPEPMNPDGRDCGPGRWHVMKKPSAQYAPDNWWPWYVKSTGTVVGESGEKYGTTSLKLRRISPKVWHRIIRLGWCKKANLSRADLSRANLSGANLYEANLYEANLSGAYLSRANLSRADLSRANLSGANLYEANLSGAYLSRANLSRADLYEANLSGANLSGADLSRADLSRADLSRADHSKFTIWPDSFDMNRLENK